MINDLNALTRLCNSAERWSEKDIKNVGLKFCRSHVRRLVDLDQFSFSGLDERSKNYTPFGFITNGTYCRIEKLW